VKCAVVRGGRLVAFSEIASPGITIDTPAVTEKDKEDIAYLLGLQPPIDYLAVPFCQSAADIKIIEDLLDKLGIPEEHRPKIIAR
jgi:pyruvate kinase